MARFIYEFEGVRGRNLKLYDTKIIITTKKTVGSLITGNFTDGEKTIFLRDVVGVQFKKSGGLIGYGNAFNIFKLCFKIIKAFCFFAVNINIL